MFGVAPSVSGGLPHVAHEPGTDRFSIGVENVTVTPQPVTEPTTVKSGIALRSITHVLATYLAVGDAIAWKAAVLYGLAACHPLSRWTRPALLFAVPACAGPAMALRTNVVPRAMA